MDKRISFGLVLVPLMGWSIGFNEFTDLVSAHSEASIANNARGDALKYEKAAQMAAEPLSLEMSSRKIRADIPEDEGMEYGFMVDWTLKMPRLKEAQAREWDTLGNSTRINGTILRRMAKVEVKRDWLLSEAASQKAKIASDKWEVSKQAYAVGKKKHEAGRMSMMELLRLETEAANAKSEYDKTHMEAEHFQHVLQEKSMMKEEVFIDDLTFSFVKNPDRAIELIEASSPVQTIQSRIDEIDAQIETQRRSTFESVSVGVGMTREPTQNSVDMRLTIPMALSSRNDSKIAALMSERSSLLHQKAIRIDKLKIAVEGRLEHLKERERQINETADAEEQYKTLFQMAQKGMEGGVVTQFEYLAAKNAFYDARWRTIELHELYIGEMNEIEESLGDMIQ